MRNAHGCFSVGLVQPLARALVFDDLVQLGVPAVLDELVGYIDGLICLECTA